MSVKKLSSVAKCEDIRHIYKKSLVKGKRQFQSLPILERLYIKKAGRTDEPAKDMIKVSPIEIQRSTIVFGYNDTFSPRYVYSGRWDRTAVSFNNLDRVRSIKNHFLYGVEWKETLYYRKVGRNYIKKGKSWRGIKSEKDLLSFFSAN